MVEKEGKICYRCMETHGADSSKCPVCGFDITDPYIYPPKEKSNILPAGSILSNRYLVGCAVLDDCFEIIYAGLDLYTEQKVFIHEFFPSEIVSRKADNNSVSIISQEDKRIFQRGKELYRERFSRIKAGIPYSEQILSYCEENGTPYMVGKAYSFVSLENMLHSKPFAKYQEEYFSVLHALKDYLQALDTEGEQYYNIAPGRIMVGNGQIVILADGKEKYQFAKNFSSKLIIPDKNYCLPGLPTGNIPNPHAAGIYSFSVLCYYIIMSATVARSHNKEGKFFQEKKLIKTIKKYNVPPALAKPIAAGVTGKPDGSSKGYIGYTVLDGYTSFPTESFFQQPNVQKDGKAETLRVLKMRKKISLFARTYGNFFLGIAGILSIIVLLCANATEKTTEAPMPSSLPSLSPTSVATRTPAPTPTVSPTPSPVPTPKAQPTVKPTEKPRVTVKPVPKPTKKPKATIKPTPKPTKKPVHTRKPEARPVPKVTARPAEPTAQPKVTPKAVVKATKKPLQEPTPKDKEEQIEGID